MAMVKKIKNLAIVVTVSMLLYSCVRSLTTYQAANRGGLKCNKTRLK